MPTQHTGWKVAVPISLLGTVAFVWVASAAFAGKADKQETHDLRTRISAQEAAALVEANKLKTIQETLDRIENAINNRMGTLEKNQQETLMIIINKAREGPVNQLPPPLNR